MFVAFMKMVLNVIYDMGDMLTYDLFLGWGDGYLL